MNDKPNSDPVSDDEPDADTLAAFNKILSKVGPQWLTEQLKTQQAPSSENSPKASTLEAYLTENIKELKQTNARLAAQMEKMRDLLTPDQLILLRSPPAAPDDAGDDPDLPKPKKPSAPPPAPPKKRSWL